MNSSWDLDQQFVVDQIHSVFIVDSHESSQSLSHNANTPDEIEGKLNTISYNKGASVIRMMKHTIGEDKFIDGLRNYLKIK